MIQHYYYYQYQSKNISVINLVKDITLNYVKFYYEKHCSELGKEFMIESEIEKFVDKMYTEKEKHLKDYIRKSLRKCLDNEYPSLTVETILSDMTDDKEFSKNRVISEIKGYQESKGYTG